MTSRRKNKNSPVADNMASRSSSRKTASTPVKDKGNNKRKRENPQSSSPSVSPPLKSRATAAENASTSSSTTRASRSRSSKTTPNKTAQESPKVATTRSGKKASPATTSMPSPARTTRATRSLKGSPATPPTTAKSSPRTPRGSASKTSQPETDSTPKSSSKTSKFSPGRTRTSRRSAGAATAITVDNTEDSKQGKKQSSTVVETAAETSKSTPVSSKNRKRKKAKSPSVSPSVPAQEEEVATSEVKSEEEVAVDKSAHVSEELSPKNRSNRRKRRKGGGEVEEEENVALSDGASESKVDSSETVSENIHKITSNDSESSTVDKTESYSLLSLAAKNTATTSESIENKVPVIDKSPVKTSRKLRVQSSETCRSAALCSIPSTAEISKYSNHSSHTNGSSSGMKRRLSNGNESDSETTDWTTKKQKPEVVIAGSDDGDVVCGAVPVIHMKSLGSPCKSASVSRSDLYEELSNSVTDSSHSSTSSSSLRGSVPTTSNVKSRKSSNSLSTSPNTRNVTESAGSKDSINQSSSITSGKPVNTSTSRNVSESLSSNGDMGKTDYSVVSTDSIKFKSTINHTKIGASSSVPKKTPEVEMKCDANASERLLSTFGLNVNQVKEISEVLPEPLRDGDALQILETLVEKLLEETRTLATMNAPRLNKLLRQLLTHFCSLDTTVEKKHSVCETALSWAKERKTMNLRHELELTLMQLYYQTGYYRKAEETANALYRETKKLQDKEKTVKACLCLSKTYHAMGNISKARANITTAKTEALKIYTPPDLQAELDLQSGIMQVAEGKDMETAFSYFKEAATGSNISKQRSRALKYMLLAKLMVNKSEDGEKAVRSSTHINDIDTGVDALIAITKAATSCSLADFKKARLEYKEELDGDLVVSGVLDHLYTKMMEKNLANIIMPYERVQISFVAERIGLLREEVERRLSQMILDGELSAQLDHRDDCLYVYKAEPKDAAYSRSIDTIKELDKTLTHLNRKVKQLL